MKHIAPFSTLIVSLLIALLAGTAQAQTANATSAPHSRAGLAQLGDPYVPPRVKAAARAMAVAPTTSGASLQAQALGKLQQKFNQADLDHTGRITKTQAKQTGFGFVANHFEQIDAQHRGSVSFDELKTFMRANGANF
ncbi:EF-hand domain-containing protein [Paludibacterium purpuratum]|uniref:EF hand domain-containing protein n=1 Tax=Paludibacterium purpuratum TaxID=1144873 RepID=A0A4R7B0N1_9NEIS|nr:EF-hand domain-containing protein [Paludibacterium purpuratum]TDR76488.1 EF hand domain-containing protein [Paludibacterium purpuratum]